MLSWMRVSARRPGAPQAEQNSSRFSSALTSHLMATSQPWETQRASRMRMAAISGEVFSPTISLTTSCRATRCSRCTSRRRTRTAAAAPAIKISGAAERLGLASRRGASTPNARANARPNRIAETKEKPRRVLRPCFSVVAVVCSFMMPPEHSPLLRPRAWLALTCATGRPILVKIRRP